jgi:hypothetical protein
MTTLSQFLQMFLFSNEDMTNIGPHNQNLWTLYYLWEISLIFQFSNFLWQVVWNDTYGLAYTFGQPFDLQYKLKEQNACFFSTNRPIRPS